MAAQRKIVVKTPLGADALLVRAGSVTEQLGRLFEIDIDLLSPDENLDFNSVLGNEITLSIDLDDGKPRYFHAFVAHFSQTGRLGRYATYHARAVPWLWFLTRTADCRIFQGKNASDIIKAIFREHGFTDFKDSLTKTYRVRDYCVQYRETDFNFVQRLMEEEGIYYYFKHTQSSHTLVMADSYSGHEAFPGYESIEYFPPSANETRETDHIYEWRLTRDIQPGKYVVTDYDFTKPRAALQTQYVQKREIPKSEYEVFDYPGGYTVTSDGDHYARARLESLQSQYERMNGVGNARGLAVGSLFKLKGYPRKDQNKEHLVVAAVHSLQGGDYESGSGASGADYTCNFEVVDAKEPFRTAITTHKPTVGGPQTATVVGPAGEEIHTDKYGRVKVKFHWDRDPERADKASCWVRVSQIWAGKNWGWMSIPRMGQEVVVDFLEGDPDQPLITGRVYNQDNMPPYDLPANKTQSGITTRSTLDGTPANANQIRFEDKKGSEQLHIHAEKNQDIEVENDETHWVGHDRKKNVDNDETTLVKHDRTETVDNDEKISIGGNRTESVGKDETISISGNRKETVSKDETISISGNRSESVDKNESVSISKNRTMDVGENESLNVDKNRNHTVGKNETVRIGDNLSETVGKKHTVEVADNQETTVGKDQRIQVGKRFFLDAGDEIILQTGSASLTLKKDGTIQLKGKDITISGSGKIGVKASSDLTLKGSKIADN